MTRFAVIGPFDIENFGDHVFKDVLKWQLRAEFPDVEIDTFAVTDGSEGFSNGEATVYGIDRLESLARSRAYDALLLAGGSVLHFATLDQIVRGRRTAYDIWRLWVESARVAAELRIPLAWNCPEAPLDFVGWERLAAAGLLDAVAFATVRDTASREAFAAVSHRHVRVNPDSAWLAPQVYTPENCLNNLLERVDDSRDLIAFHCNPRLREADIPQLLELLGQLQQAGSQVVLLPLAYTNGERDWMLRLQERAGNRFSLPIRELTPPETVSVLAAAKAYIGLSFHGAIVSACFGAQTIAFDYEERRKTRDLYDRMGRAHCYGTSLDDVRQILQRRSSPGEDEVSATAIASLQGKVRDHFRDLHEFLMDPRPTRKARAFADTVAEVADVVDTEVRRREAAARELEAQAQNHRAAYEQLNKIQAMYDDLLRQYQGQQHQFDALYAQFRSLYERYEADRDGPGETLEGSTDTPK